MVNRLMPALQPRLHHAFILLFASTLMAPMTMISGQQAQAQEWSAPRTVYIPETGHTLDQVFLDQWREAGGASTYGYPVTPEITLDDGTIVQYLQYARFEYYPNGNANGDFFALGDIGEELRPFSLQRSVAGFTSTGNADESGAAETNAAVIAAWLPVDQSTLASPQVRYVEATGHTVRYAFLNFWEETGEAGFLGNPLTQEYVTDGVTYQVFERGQLAWENGKEAWLMPVGQILADKYQLDQEPVAQGDIPTYSEDLFVPPPAPAPAPYGPGPVADTSKSIVVSISQQRMWAYEGETLFLTSLVSTGKPGFDTPTGMFSISKKVPIQDMEGLIGGEYYNVTDVTDVMYFTTVGHAFHGTYWHNNFGAVMSHGCVNLPMDVASVLYDWTPMYTPVQIVN